MAMARLASRRNMHCRKRLEQSLWMISTMMGNWILSARWSQLTMPPPVAYSYCDLVRRWNRVIRESNHYEPEYL